VGPAGFRESCVRQLNPLKFLPPDSNGGFTFDFSAPRLRPLRTPSLGFPSGRFPPVSASKLRDLAGFLRFPWQRRRNWSLNSFQFASAGGRTECHTRQPGEPVHPLRPHDADRPFGSRRPRAAPAPQTHVSPSTIGSANSTHRAFRPPGNSPLWWRFPVPQSRPAVARTFFNRPPRHHDPRNESFGAIPGLFVTTDSASRRSVQLERHGEPAA